MQDYKGQVLTRQNLPCTLRHFVTQPVDAKQNSRSRRHVQGSLQRVVHLGLYLCPPASVWYASPLSTLCYVGGVDSIHGLPYGRRGWHTSPTCEATYWQNHYRWGAGATPGSHASSGLRRVNGRSPQ